MKYETYSEYDPAHSALAESAFLTIWGGLGQWHDRLVLIGGMVPKYLCGKTDAPNALPRPVTLDVDLGIALAADEGQYGNLSWELRAFFNRQQPKDAFDILYTVLHYDGGIDAAIAAFAEEIGADNPACEEALLSLREHFATEASPGPVKASHFVLGSPSPGESEEMAFQRASIRQDAVSAATRLLDTAEQGE